MPRQFKIVLSFCFILGLIVGCSQNEKTSNNQNSSQYNAIDYDSTIYNLSKNIYNANQVFVDKIINEKSKLSKESIASIKSLIDVELNRANENYKLLTTSSGDKQNQIDILKKALDKLKSMDSDLENYTDDIEGKQKLFSDWKIVNNYWTTYYEMNKK